MMRDELHSFAFEAINHSLSPNANITHPGGDENTSIILFSGNRFHYVERFVGDTKVMGTREIRDGGVDGRVLWGMSYDGDNWRSDQVRKNVGDAAVNLLVSARNQEPTCPIPGIGSGVFMDGNIAPGAAYFSNIDRNPGYNFDNFSGHEVVVNTTDALQIYFRGRSLL